MESGPNESRSPVVLKSAAATAGESDTSCEQKQKTLEDAVKEASGSNLVAQGSVSEG